VSHIPFAHVLSLRIIDTCPLAAYAPPCSFCHWPF
jgi:hypothetical protein